MTAASPATSGSSALVRDAPVTNRTLAAALQRVDVQLQGRAHLAILATATFLAWVVRFDQDDAFISYRYARNLAHGHGLVFIPGQRVEGYTNFLWTVLLSIPERLGWSTPVFGQALGMLAFVVALLLMNRFTARFLPDRGQQLLALLVLCTNMTFLAYATSGMETMLQTTLLLGMATLLLPAAGGAPDRIMPWGAAGLLGGLALLTRLDSAVLVVAVAVVAVVSAHRAGADGERSLVRLLGQLATSAVVAAVVVVPWLVWKQHYYGSVIPNTFVAKSGAHLLTRVAYGLLYLVAFFLSYGAFLLVPRLLDTWRDRDHLRRLAPAVAVSATWCAYVCWVGADFMEFRFMVPIMPYLAVIGAVVIDPITRWTRWLIATLLLMSVLHRVVPVPGIPVMSIATLNQSVRPDELPAFGQNLARWFATDDLADAPVLATTTLGAIGYGSDLHVIDMVGLTNPEIARNGIPEAHYYPGHVRIASIPQLWDAGVDLVIGTPLPVASEPDRTDYDVRELIPRWPVVDLGDLPESARVIELPFNDGAIMPAIQLRRSPVVDAAVERGGWRTFPIDRSCHGDGPDDLLIRAVTAINGTATCGS